MENITSTTQLGMTINCNADSTRETDPQHIRFNQRWQYFIVCLAVLNVACGFFSYVIFNIPLFDEYTSYFGHGSATVMSFLLITHIRALWKVPKWTKQFNIYIDICTSLPIVSLAPSVSGVVYVLLHVTFATLFLTDTDGFEDLFQARSSSDAYVLNILSVRSVYYIVTLFELIYQSRFIYLYGTVYDFCFAMIIYNVFDVLFA